MVVGQFVIAGMDTVRPRCTAITGRWRNADSGPSATNRPSSPVAVSRSPPAPLRMLATVSLAPGFSGSSSTSPTWKAGLPRGIGGVRELAQRPAVPTDAPPTVSEAREADGILVSNHLMSRHVADGPDASQRTHQPFTSPSVGFSSFTTSTTLARSCAQGSISWPRPSRGEA